MTTRIKLGKHHATFTKTIADRIAKSPKTQRQIAAEMGYRKPNLITMFKQGLTKVPLGKVPALAHALEIDEDYLMRLALQEYEPELYEVMRQSTAMSITDSERKIIDVFREATRDTNPTPTDEQLEKLRKMFT